VTLGRRVALVVVAGALVGLVVALRHEPEPTYEYPPEVVDNFIGACRTRAPEEACRCAIDRLRDRFPWEEFRDMERRMGAGEMPAEVAEAVRGCVGG